MKKNYITPEMNSINLDVNSLLCNSIRIGIKDDTEGTISNETGVWSNEGSKFNNSIWD